jgi:hypothetical protein
VVIEYEALERTYKTGVCQDPQCRQAFLNDTEFVVDFESGHKYHTRCYRTRTSDSDEAVLAPAPTSRWRFPKQREVCQLALTRWKAFLYPTDLTIVCTPWTRPRNATSHLDNFVVQWSADAARRFVWPDSASLNFAPTVVCQHMFPLAWLTSGAMHWVTQLGGDDAKGGGNRAPALQRLQLGLAKSLRDYPKLVVDPVLWVDAKHREWVTLRVQWSAVVGSAEYYAPVTQLQKGAFADQAGPWQLAWQHDFVDPLRGHVTRILQQLTAVNPELGHDLQWRTAGIGQPRAQFVTDEKQVGAWVGLVPHPSTSQTHYVIAERKEGAQQLYRIIFRAGRQKPAGLPYAVPSVDELRPADLSHVADARVALLERVDALDVTEA